MWDFIEKNWGNLASVAGLIISVFTLLFARRASQAAREAREAVLKSNLADDLQEAVNQSQELRVFLGINQWRIARLKAVELQDKAIWLRERWEQELDLESLNRLTEAGVQLQRIVENIERLSENSVSEEHKEKLLRAADQARQAFLKAHGKFKAKID